MTHKQKINDLNQMLTDAGLFPKYFIKSGDARLGSVFAVASADSERGTLSVHTSFISYKEMNAYLTGYYNCLHNPLT